MCMQEGAVSLLLPYHTDERGVGRGGHGFSVGLLSLG